MRCLPAPTLDGSILYDRIAQEREPSAGNRVRALRPRVLEAYWRYGPNSAAVVALQPFEHSHNPVEALGDGCFAAIGVVRRQE